MGLGFKHICILSAIGTGVIAGVAIASRNDYSAEKMWNKTKRNTIHMTKKATNAVNPRKNKNLEIEKSANEALTVLAKEIDVTLEDSEIIVANNVEASSEETPKIISLPSINQICQTQDFSSNLFFINSNLDNAKLRKSLEILLNTYSILSGRIMNNKKTGLYEVCLNNKGVFLSMVKYNGNMFDILPNTDENVTSPDYSNLYGQSYNLKKYVSLNLPILQIRITHFNDDKTCIGLRYPSIIADMTSMAKFVEDWSVLYRGEEIQKNTIFNSDWISQSVKTLHDDNLPSTYQPLAFNKIKSFNWFKLAFQMFYEWVIGGGFQTKHFFISDKQLEELRNQVISDAKFANENQTSSIQSPTSSDIISPTDSSNIDWISAKDVLIAHIWKKVSVLPRKVTYSNRVFKCCNLREYVSNIENTFGNMNIYAVTPLTFITLLSPLYYLSKKIHTSMFNLSIQIENLLQWISCQESFELPLIGIPAILFGRQSDLLVDDIDVDRSNIRFSSSENKEEGNILWIYKENKPNIPNYLSIVRTSELTNDSQKGYYIYLTLSRIDMNAFINQGGL